MRRKHCRYSDVCSIARIGCKILAGVNAAAQYGELLQPRLLLHPARLFDS
jgi:hypothetical protein